MAAFCFIAPLQGKETKLREADGGREKKSSDEALGFQRTVISATSTASSWGFSPACWRALSLQLRKKIREAFPRWLSQPATVLCCLLHSQTVAFPAAQERNVLGWDAFEKRENWSLNPLRLWGRGDYNQYCPLSSQCFWLLSCYTKHRSVVLLFF